MNANVTPPLAARGPGIRIPPPLIYLAGWGLAWLLDRRLSFEIDAAGVSWPQLVLGLVSVVTGVTLMVSGITTFARAGTPIVPHKAARALVITGPYRFTRNPIYLGFTAIYFGLALVFNQAWPVVMLPLVLAVLSLAVINREERHLHLSFGDAYDGYCQRVRRWL